MKKNLKRKQKGVALLTAVIVMFTLTLLAMGFAVEKGADVGVSRAYLDKIKTLYIAQAGFNRARTAISLGDEPDWTLGENASISPPDEAFAGGLFSVTASSTAADVDITSTGSIGTRTQRIVEETGIARGGGGGGVSAVASSNQATAGNAIDYLGGNDNANVEYGFGASWQAAASIGQNIYLDFGSPVSFDYLLIVLGGTKCAVSPYTVDVWNDSTGTWTPQVDMSASSTQPLDRTGKEKLKNAPPLEELQMGDNFWVAVNFTNHWTVPDCDNNPNTPAGSNLDHCVGVLSPGVQNSSRVRFTGNFATCLDVDWMEAKTGGTLVFPNVNSNFVLTGADVVGGDPGGILPPPTDFTER